MGEVIGVIIGGIAIILVAGFFIVLYMLPYVLSRGKSFSSSVFWFNLLLAWTFIGWIIALVWAVSQDDNDPALKNQPISDASINALEALGQLRTQGYITQTEYDLQKQNLLSNQSNLAKNIIALARLGRLYAQGLITYKEFADQKNKLLGNTANKSTTSLETLKRLHREALITDKEYEDQRNQILGNNTPNNSAATNQADNEIKNDSNATPYKPSNNQ